MGECWRRAATLILVSTLTVSVMSAFVLSVGTPYLPAAFFYVFTIQFYGLVGMSLIALGSKSQEFMNVPFVHPLILLPILAVQWALIRYV